MRTQNIKFLRSDNGRLFMFRYSGGTIYSRIIDRNSYSDSIKIVNGVSPEFSLWNNDGRIYLLCSSVNKITLCLYQDGKWISRALFDKSEGGFSWIDFLAFRDTIHLIYSVKSNGTESLFIRSAKSSNWGHPVKADDIVPFSDAPFLIGRENQSAVRIYYRTSEGDIKFRKFGLGDGILSDATDLLSVNMPFRDISILTEDGGCHILYLVKGPFSSQLIYKGIKDQSSSRAKIIWEGQLSGSCSLMKNDGRLYALIYDRTKCFAAFSDDNGANFSIAKNLGVKLGDSCLKAEYTDFQGSAFLADEIPVDISSFSFPVTEDIFPQFIPSAIKPEPSQDQPPRPSQSTNNEDLNGRIKELNALLSKRNDELAATTASWKTRYDALLKENSALRAELGSLRAASIINTDASQTSQENE